MPESEIGNAKDNKACGGILVAKVRLLELRNTYKWGGGPDKTILLSAERHDRNRIDTVVAYVRDALDSEFQIAEKARQKGLTFYEIEETKKLDFNVLDKLCEIIRRHKINLIHAHDYKTDLFAYLLRSRLRDLRPAAISTMHGWAMAGMRGRLYWWMDVWLMRRLDHLIAVSQATKNEMVAAAVSSANITVIHNGIDTGLWSRSLVKHMDVQPRDLGMAGGHPVIGYVGRISPEKNLATWLRASAQVVKFHPTTRLVMVGEGRDDKLVNQLKSLASQLGIAANLEFLGYREDLAAIYSTFDIFLLSSSTEGICNSLLEAMAMAVPVVTTDAGGTKELIVNGLTGFMLPVGDVTGLATAMLKLVENRHLRDSMGEAARKHIEAKFSFLARLRQVESLYESIVEQYSGSHKRTGSKVALCVE